MENFFLGRQPILDADGTTIAYELLFRSSEVNAYDAAVSGDSATSQVLINAVTELGINRIVGDRLAFINLTNMFFENPDLLDFLPPGRVVFEVLETVVVNPAVVEGVRTLKEAGYLIALDDFVMSPEIEPLLDMAAIVKYDTSQYDRSALCEIAQGKVPGGPLLLAERVETAEDFNVLRDAGFDYFQGYYFARPTIVRGTKLPADKITLLQLLAQLNGPDVSIDDIADVLAREVSLAVRALKWVNSPMSGVRCEVTSIKQAAVLLGRNTIRNWVTMLLMAGMNDKPLELVTMALIRGRFCQLAAQREGLADDGYYFTIGLLSLLDVMMDLEMAVVLDNISATQEMRDVLKDGIGRAGELLRAVKYLELSGPGPTPPDAPVYVGLEDAYVDAIVWAQETSRLIAA